MKKTRIFIAFLMVVTLLAFTGCANDGADVGPADNGTNGTTNNQTVDDGMNDAGNDVRDGVNDLDGNGMNDNNSTNTTGGGVNNNNAAQ